MSRWHGALTLSIACTTLLRELQFDEQKCRLTLFPFHRIYTALVMRMTSAATLVAETPVRRLVSVSNVSFIKLSSHHFTHAAVGSDLIVRATVRYVTYFS